MTCACGYAAAMFGGADLLVKLCLNARSRTGVWTRRGKATRFEIALPWVSNRRNDLTMPRDTELRRANQFEIDLGAIVHNLSELRRVVGSSTTVFAALKGNAYGFGLEPVARTVVEHGADAVALADLHDAVTLRRSGVTVPILLYAGNLLDVTTVESAARYGFILTVLQAAGAKLCAELAPRPVEVFIKLDVGLERLGVPPEQAIDLARLVDSLPGLVLRGLYTHLDIRRGPGAVDYVDWQLCRYRDVCEGLDASGIDVATKLVASSALLGYGMDVPQNAVDPGHMLFGLMPPAPATVELDLRPAFASLSSRLIQVRDLDRTEFREFAPVRMRENMRVGVMPMGLRDGIGAFGCEAVLVRGRRVNIAGAYSLEHTRIDLTDVPEAEVGDEVVVVGRQRDAEISPAEVLARQQNLLEVELAMSIRESVPRSYIPPRPSAV